MKYDEQTCLSIRVNKKLKNEADELFKDLGLNMSTAVNMFLTQCVKEESIPFQVSRKPSKELKEALKELDDFEKGKIELKGYHDVDKMFEDILNDK